METEENKNDKKTYFSIGNVSDLMLEIDLTTYRQKGNEVRFVSLSLSKEVTPEIEEGTEEVPQKKVISSSFNIESEEEFNRFKQFVSGLNWND